MAPSRSSAKMLRKDIDYCLKVRNACLQIHLRLMNLIPSANTKPGFAVVNYSAEIEAKVDAIYREMYDEQMTIDEVIALLQCSKASSDPRDHKIFSCMLHFLFNEYKFFQSYYPARELTMTGYLFGSIIQHKLVDLIPFRIVLPYVIDALRCPPKTNLFKFGPQALARFESHLPEWKSLCQVLSGISHLMEARPDLAATIHHVIAAGDGSNGDMRALVADPVPVFTAIQPEKMDAKIVTPVEELSDKVLLFIVNNLVPGNFDAKLMEMKDYFDNAYAKWFTDYLVDQ